MARFELRLKRSAAKDLEKLPDTKTRRRILERIAALTDDPRPPGCEKLSGQADKYRVRQGRHRIPYEIRDRELLVFVVKIADLRDADR